MTNNDVVHNFCESRLNNDEPPEIFNSYTSLFITIIPIILGLPKNNIFFNLAIMLIFNGFASFYYHYTLSWTGKQADEMSMIMATYFGINGLMNMLFLENNKYQKFYLGVNNVYMITFLIFNAQFNTDMYFPYLFSFYIAAVLFLINRVYNKYKNIQEYKQLISYQKELLISSLGAICWIISELFCNTYTKFGHVLWHLLFPLGFYQLIIKYDEILDNYYLN